MKAVILAGGAGTRLHPLTYSINKHMLPVGKYPMILHSYLLLDKLELEIDSILVATRPDAVGSFSTLLSHYPKWAEKTFFAAQRESQGIPDAIKCARHFVKNDPFLVILGDNLIDHDNIFSIRKALADENNASIWLKEVSNPEQFGVAIVEDNKIRKIIEKPKTIVSNSAIVGLYTFNKHFWEVLPTLSLSSRNEYEITDVLNSYLEIGCLSHHIYHGEWLDLGHSIEKYLAASASLI